MVLIDARIPLRFGPIEDRAPDEAVLTDAQLGATPGTTPTHPIDCLCCTPRSAAALALATLFRNRAIGQGPPFRAVLAAVSPAHEAAIRAALQTDPLASGRFRLA